MKIRITTFDDAGNEIITRDFKNDNDSNHFTDEILYQIIEDTIEHICDECGNTGKVTKGDFDNIEEVDCYKCKKQKEHDDA